MNILTTTLAKWLVLPALLGCLKTIPPQPVSVPILLYHHIDETGEGDMAVSQSCFEAHLDAIQEAGFETISFQDLYDYVYLGTPLPKRCVVITFDDGYESNYALAYPALKERGMEATVFVIGASVGRDTDQETQEPIIPHFSYEDAAQMVEDGTISIQSHTYGLHNLGSYSERSRKGVGRIEGESLHAYCELLEEDFSQSVEEIQEHTGQRVLALAYPFGITSEEAEDVCGDLHIPITVTTQWGFAQIQQGNPASLRKLSRFTVDDCTTEDLINCITIP